MAQNLLQRALALAQTEQCREEIELLGLLALLSWRQGQYAAARTYAQQALDIAQTGDERLKAYSLRVLGLIYYYLGEYTIARTYFEQAVAFYYTIGDRRGEISAFYHIGALYFSLEEIETAQDYFEQTLATAQQIGDREIIANTLGYLGLVYCKLGDYTSARGYLGQSLGLHQELGNRPGEADVFSKFGYVYYCMGNYKTAQRYCHLALEIQTERGDGHSRSYSLTCLGHVLADQEELEAAAQAYQEVISLYQQMDRTQPAVDALAGLARVKLKENELTQALAYIEQVLAWIELHGTAGAIDPFWIYLAVYQVMTVQPALVLRAQIVLRVAYNTLQAKVSGLRNNAVRRNFLTNIKVNRELVSLWEALSNTSTVRMR
jgi:tetratricopeptide (TPR) repeat protein